MGNYTMSRDDYRRIADEIMHYVCKELGMDKITALPFVANITEEIRPIVEGIVDRQLVAPEQPKAIERINHG